MPVVDVEIDAKYEAAGLKANRSLEEDQATTQSTALFGAHKGFYAKLEAAIEAAEEVRTLAEAAEAEEKAAAEERAAAAEEIAELLQSIELPDGYNLGQGAEKEKPDEVINQLKDQTIKASEVFSPVYSKMEKGRLNVHTQVCGRVTRNFGVDFTAQDENKKQQAFLDVLAGHGRDGLFKTILAARRAHSKSDQKDQPFKVAIPEFCWPMYSTLLEMVGAEAILYKNPGPGEGFDPDAFEKVKEAKVIISNTEENPSGTLYSMDYMLGLRDWAEDFNEQLVAQGKQPIAVALDCPYYASRQANRNADFSKGEHNYDTSPIKPFIMETKFTPVTAAVPETKFGATAEIGFTPIIQNALAQGMLKDVLKSTNGLSGVNPMFDMLAEFSSAKHHEGRLNFEEKVRGKYAANRQTLLAGMENVDGVEVYPGDAGLTGLLELDLNHFFGKTVDGPMTGAYLIEDMTDIVEFLFLNYGVVTVNNGAKDGVGYIRVANAEFPEHYQLAVHQLSCGFEKIANTPAPGLTGQENDAAMGNDGLGEFEPG